jgi:hypothetical protein
MKSKYLLPALLFAISGVPPADANMLGASELQRCERIYDQLLQARDDTIAANQGSASDKPTYECRAMMDVRVRLTTEVTGLVVYLVKDSIATTDRGAEAAVNSSLSKATSMAESVLALIRKPVNVSGSCSYDSVVVATRKELLRLADGVSDCVTSVKVKLSAAK